METLLNANIFFFITTISVILLTGVLVVLLIYLAQVMRNIRDITSQVKKQGEEISKDIDELRSNLKKEGMKFKHWLDFFSKLVNKSKKKSRK